MKTITIDTEYDENKVPFVATVCDEQLKTSLYEIKNRVDYKHLTKTCEDKSTLKVFHALLNDIYALGNVNVKIEPPYGDTMIAATILNENYETKKLKGMAKLYLNEECNEERALSKLKAKLKREAQKEGRVFSYRDIPPKILYPYARQDVVYTMKLWYLFKGPLKEFKDLYDFEISLTPIILQMVQTGMRVNRKLVAKFLKEYLGEQKKWNGIISKELLKHRIKFFDEYEYKYNERNNKERIQARLDKKEWREDISKIDWNQKKGTCTVFVKRDFNPGSSPDLRRAIDKLDIPILNKTSTGELAADRASIEPFKDEYPFVNALLKYRFYTKQITTYYDPLLNYYTSPTNDTAHFMLYQTGAKTGRFSAELVQTMPRTDEYLPIEDQRFIRKAFIPREGYYYLAIDYDQIEMRLFAHFSKCQTLLDAIHSGKDIHAAPAYEIFGPEIVDYSEATYKAARKATKTINFGVIYGMGVGELTRNLNDIVKELRSYLPEDSDIEIPPPNEILAQYHKNYPVREFVNDLTKQLYKQGYITLEVDSPLMKFKRHYRVPKELAYKAANTKIQGCAAYVIKFAIKRVVEFLKKKKYNIRLLMQIHDELIFEVHKSIPLKKIYPELREVMEDRVTFSAPLEADGKWSDISWGDCKKIK